MWGQSISDGVYYIKTSDKYQGPGSGIAADIAEKCGYDRSEKGSYWYLWPSVTTNAPNGTNTLLDDGNGTEYYRYLTTLHRTDALAYYIDDDHPTWSAMDDSYCHWVVKYVGTNDTKKYYQIINPKLNKYINWINDGKSTKNFWLKGETSGNDINKMYFWLDYQSSDNSINQYYIHPYNGSKTTSVLNIKGNNKPHLSVSGSNHEPTLTTGDGNGLAQGTTTTDYYVKFDFISNLLAKPTIGDYDLSAQKVAITETNGLPPGYNIRYTFSSDGTPDDPTATTTDYIENSDGTPNEITITEPGTLKVVIERYGVVLTEVAEKEIIKVATPTIINDGTNIVMGCATEGATIYYTTGDSDPDENSTEYTYPLPVSSNLGNTFKAIAVKSGCFNSDISEPLTITATCPMPTISFSNSDGKVTIVCSDAEAIYYTLDGSTPDPDYVDGDYPTKTYAPASKPTISATTTVKAIATKTGYANSSVAEKTFEQLVAPSFTFDGTSLLVTITPNSTVEGVSTVYTVNNESPTTTSAAYIEPIAITANTTVKAMNVKEGYVNSEIASLPVDLSTTGYAGIYYLQNQGNTDYYMYPASSTSYVQTAKNRKISAVWQIKRHDRDYYQIIHYEDSKYMVADATALENTVTLESTDSPGDNALYSIAEVPEGNGSLKIMPKGAANDEGKIYLNVTGGNKDNHTIGLSTAGKDDKNSHWKFVKVPASPSFTVTDITVKMDAPLGDVYYIVNNVSKNGNITPENYDAATKGKSVTLKYGPKYKVWSVAKYKYATNPDKYWESDPVSQELQVNLLNPAFFVTADNKVTIMNSQKDGVTFLYFSSNNGNSPADPVAPNGDGTGRSGTVYSEAISLTDNALNVFKAIAYNTVDGVTYKSDVVSYVVDLRGAVEISNLAGITSTTGKYKIKTGFTATGTPKVNGDGDVIGTESNPFQGTLDGDFVEIELGNNPLFACVQNATIKNVIIKSASVSTNGNAGAIANVANGDSRIYNCGLLGGSVSGDSNVGSIVGLLDGTSRVINCYSFANVSGGSMAAGIVGNNNQTSTQTNLKTIVVNCMFYGTILNGTAKYPVYGGQSINNDANDGINPYCYFRKNASFTPTDYNRSWPAEDKNLTRFEYYRSVLNSNRKLCTWWVNGLDGYAPNDYDMESVGIAKWVLDPSIAPYPILKKWGKYPSVINQNPDKRVNPSTKKWDDRDDASSHWEKHMAPDTDGQILGSVSVTINAGNHYSGSNSSAGRTINITAMDTEYDDYCYGKIQLPYYNEVFGNPDGTSHSEKYAGNYTDWVVTGWEISGGSDAENYNFADRNSYNGRIFAQGGYFYVPDGMESVTITAHWGKAVYLANRGLSIDRVKVTAANYKDDKPFTPAGTISNKFQNQTVYDDLQKAINALGTGPTVYDQAIVLIGNHQVKNGSNSVAGSSGKWHPFTIMSADLDFDNEPDYCLQLQFRSGVDRPGIQPVRFDFLPVIELGLAVRHDNLAYAIGIMVPQGHFEITETAFMRTTQFEWDASVTRYETESPVILNGGEFEQLAVRYKEGNRTSYFLLGGHLWFHRFAPGSHPISSSSGNPRLCPVNVIGGDFPEFYLSGLYRPDKTPSDDQGNPKCYINGGHFGTIHGAGYDKINGSVTFKIDHADIGEFYGGGINGSNPIGGNIDVTIDNSRVDKYCGGPEVGNMTGKTVTTSATGTTFGVFYGGGNGGNSYYRDLQDDGDWDAPTGGGEIGETFWNNRNYHWSAFNPLGVKDDDITKQNKGYHAEYEFEVFNQSNGVADQITQRGFIKWIQFGITITGNVTNTLTDCTIENNFYGGGNLATVNGTVTSTLTSTTVKGNAFGAGYSADIPTFQVHDKSTKVFPSITAGVITDGHIDNDDKVYKWTNDLYGKTEDERKASPTYQKEGDPQWYCYTWNSLKDLGVVKNTVSLSIDGDSKVGTMVQTVNPETSQTESSLKNGTGNVYGGGDASDVEGSTTVTVAGNTEVFGDVFGGGNNGEVSGTATVKILETLPTE